MSNALSWWRRFNSGDAIAFILTAVIMVASFATDGNDAYFFPRLTAVVLLGLCLLRTATVWRERATPQTPPQDGGDFRRALPALCVLAVHLAVADYLGFYTSAGAAFFALSAIYGDKTPQSLLRSAILACFVAAVLYGIFAAAVGVQTPEGILI